VTTTRYPGNPDFHEIPPHCSDCGRFCGGWNSKNPVVWKTVNPHDDMPTMHRCRCLKCVVDRVMEEYGIDDREEARHEVLGAISG
jgi:hypothetical protein